MDIDLMLGSFDLPSDRPHWEAALLAKLSEAPGVGDGLQRQERLSHPERPRSAVILPFTRPATT
jgi:hypothetical protein